MVVLPCIKSHLTNQLFQALLKCDIADKISRLSTGCRPQE